MQNNIIQLDQRVELLHHGLLMTCVFPDRVFLVIDVVIVTTAVDLHCLQELLKFFESRHSGDTQNITHRKCTCL